LLGRCSDEWFATRWQTRSGEWAEKLNSMPKYVASTTLNRPMWSNSTLIRGDVADEVATLKQQINGEILVYASYQLVQTLLEHDLVDELRLVVFPVLLGAGKRLFGETGSSTPLRLIHLNTIGDGLTHLTYRVVEAQ
ncbi:dihydrofolate reductase family protein, partial [Mycobacterium sp.]|uniref:dihydrofolate reductase family protein n=1 Tax=Mycobacterium sp. TaxID=1785 RepID=UPI003BAFF8C0